MANTTRGIPYPNDYAAAADVPAALQSLAAKVDELVGGVDTKASNAASSAATANTAATNAANAVASHSHNASGSVNIGINAVTGLSTALTGKSDTTHTHSTYALTTHTHTAAELAAHTHSDYSLTTHTHTQAQSHNTPDTDTATGIHHTLGTGANQSAPGNHAHSGYSTTDHTHSGYAATTHTHSDYSLSGHNHAADYAALSHTHSSITGFKYASGTASISMGTSSFGNATVSYSGFTTTPSVVVTPVGTSLYVGAVISATSTSATLQARQINGATGGSVSVYWIAIGT